MIFDKALEVLDGMSITQLRKVYGEYIPDFLDMANDRAAFLISNSHLVTHGAWPYPSNSVVEVGGIHCKKGKELPRELNDFMNANPDGVIYVSFGSAIRPSEMKEDRKLVFLEAFKMIDKPIIWKWDDGNVTGIPPNVRVSKWLPQNDILAHPNLKVFVTHGGLLSMQEAIFHNKPVVGIPLSNDQHPNLLRAQQHGFAIMLDLQTMTANALVSAILKSMDDIEIQNSVKWAHKMFTEEDTETPMARAVGAVEYVMRHKNIHLLKSKGILEIPWYQRYGYDIAIFALAISFLNFYLFYKCFNSCCTC